jgi:hypothetical protein
MKKIRPLPSHATKSYKFLAQLLIKNKREMTTINRMKKIICKFYYCFSIRSLWICPERQHSMLYNLYTISRYYPRVVTGEKNQIFIGNNGNGTYMYLCWKKIAYVAMTQSRSCTEAASTEQSACGVRSHPLCLAATAILHCVPYHAAPPSRVAPPPISPHMWRLWRSSRHHHLAATRRRSPPVHRRLDVHWALILDVLP